MTDLQPRLNRIKATLREAIALSEKLPVGPWYYNPYRACIGQQDPSQKPDYAKRAVAQVHAAIRDGDKVGHLFAHARTLLPATAKITLDDIEAFEELACLGNGNEWGNSTGNCIAQRRLTEIANSWPE